MDLSQGAVRVFWFYFQFNEMTQYKSVNVNLSNPQIKKLESATKSAAGITLRL